MSSEDNSIDKMWGWVVSVVFKGNLKKQEVSSFEGNFSI